MKWYKPIEKMPPLPSKDDGYSNGEPFLGVFQDSEEGDYFYVVSAEWDNPGYKTKLRYVEAGGEQYSYWDENELIAWTSLEELKKDFCAAFTDRPSN